MNRLTRWSANRHRSAGQALVEFALSLIVFLTILMGRRRHGPRRSTCTTACHRRPARSPASRASIPGVTLGNEPAITAVINTQKRLIPSLGNPTFSCVDIDGSAVASTCVAGDQVKVTITAPWTPMTPLLSLTGTWNVQVVQLGLHPVNKERRPMTRVQRSSPGRDERGQIIVIFALALIAIVAAVGLVLDGGVDLRPAANPAERGRPGLAGGRQRLPPEQRLERRRSRGLETVAGQNGFTNGVARHDRQRRDQHDQRRPRHGRHQRAPSRTTSPRSSACRPGRWARRRRPRRASRTRVNGGGPLLFSIDAFGSNGTPLPQYRNPAVPYRLRRGQRRHPERPGRHRLDELRDRATSTRTMSATSSTAASSINKTIDFNEYIGQHNQGNHTALYERRRTST